MDMVSFFHHDFFTSSGYCADPAVDARRVYPAALDFAARQAEGEQVGVLVALFGELK
jgi:hypothetical protein